MTVVGLICLIIPLETEAQQQDRSLERVLQHFEDTRISGLWYLAYDIEERADETTNEFNLKRGYLTVEKDLSRHFSTRFTQDIRVDQEGDGKGDIETRLKYGFLSFNSHSSGFFTDVTVETGVVARPWVDFEQSINRYRVQGSMFTERSGIVRSADYGITFSSQFGGKVDEQFEQEVNSSNPGRYGSVAVGVYNGGGYAAVEENNNKLVEARLTLRPLPDQLPGLQFSGLGGYGKGNTPEAPDFDFIGGYLSYEDTRWTLTGTYFQGTGDIYGALVNTTGSAIDHTGYSGFGELKLFDQRLRFIGRFDLLDRSGAVGEWYQQRYIGGIAYQFLEKSKILLDYEFNRFYSSSDYARYEVAIEIGF